MENNLKLVCPKCGTPHQPHSPHTMDADGFERCEIRTVMEDRGWCFLSYIILHLHVGCICLY